MRRPLGSGKKKLFCVILVHCRSQAGTVGTMAVMLLFILMLMGTALFACNVSETILAKDSKEGVSAQYLAEAGVLYGKEWLRVNGGTRQPKTLTVNISELGEVTINSTWLKTEQAYSITAQATVNNLKRQSQVIAPVEDVYDYAVYGGLLGRGDASQCGVAIYPGVAVIGKVGSLRCVGAGEHTLAWITGGAQLQGDVEAGGTIAAGIFDGAVFSGGKKEQAAIGKSLPIVEYTRAGRVPLNQCAQRQGNSSYYQYKLVTGEDYYYDGDFVLDSGATYQDQMVGSGTLIINGSFTVKPGASVKGGPLLIMATDTIYIGTGEGYNVELASAVAPANVEKAVLIANRDIFIHNFGSGNNSLLPAGMPPFSGSYPLLGSVLAQNKVILYGGAKIIYDKEMIDFFRGKNKLPSVRAEVGRMKWAGYEVR